MKIKVKTILRGSNLIADINDIIDVDDELGKQLIQANAAEEIVKVVEVFEIIKEETIEEIEEIIKEETQIEATPTFKRRR